MQHRLYLLPHPLVMQLLLSVFLESWLMHPKGKKQVKCLYTHLHKIQILRDFELIGSLGHLHHWVRQIDQ